MENHLGVLDGWSLCEYGPREMVGLSPVVNCQLWCLGLWDLIRGLDKEHIKKILRFGTWKSGKRVGL